MPFKSVINPNPTTFCADIYLKGQIIALSVEVPAAVAYSEGITAHEARTRGIQLHYVDNDFVVMQSSIIDTLPSF